jgi:DNA primase
MAFPPQFLDEIRARVPLSDVVGKQVRLIRRGREFVGLCPFHKEKSPSFAVVEDKGFFHCFGCGAHGDVIGFLMRTENLSFPESVERLAGLAGLQMPEQSPVERERAKRAATLYDVLEEACRWFEEQLRTPGAAEVRAYLERRGVRSDTVERFRLGYAPDARSRLIQHLKGKEVPDRLMAEAGLAVGGEDGRDAGDRFRHRLIFPITDRGGRVIAFGGRTMGDHPAKYLNSPETPVFHKGALLYGYALARKAAHEAGTVIVAEGYMDVIALAQAGFAHAVAPLGTALTEAQIGLLWKMADEPILCFDGDSAGKRAAFRSVERALPLLQPGRSLRFALLPGGQDPDDLIRARGKQAMAQVLASAVPLLDMLWKSRIEGGRFDTPERRAGLEQELNQAIATIGDTSVRFHYQSAMRARLREVFGAARRANRPQERRMGQGGGRSAGRRQGGWNQSRWSPPELEQRPSAPGARHEDDPTQRMLLVLPILVPGLLERVAERLAEVGFAAQGFGAVRDALFEAAMSEEILDREALERHLTATGLSAVVRRLLPEAGRSGDDPVLRVESVDEGERLWHHAFELYQHHALDEEIEADAAAWAVEQSDEAWQRLKAKQELKQATEARLLQAEDDA